MYSTLYDNEYNNGLYDSPAIDMLDYTDNSGYNANGYEINLDEWDDNCY